jgi:hypothetical protein
LKNGSALALPFFYHPTPGGYVCRSVDHQTDTEFRIKDYPDIATCLIQPSVCKDFSRAN